MIFEEFSKAPSYKKLLGGIELDVSAPGKVILHGEHSVVYGKLAVAASLGLRSKAHLVEIDSFDSFVLKITPLNFQCEFSINVIRQMLLDTPLSLSSLPAEFNWETPSLIDHQKHIASVERAVNYFFKEKNIDVSIVKSAKCLLYLFSAIVMSADIEVRPMCITLDSELTMGAGTGSSASFSVSCAGLFIRYLRLKVSNTQSNVSKPSFKQSYLDKLNAGNAHFSERELAAISDWAFCAEKIFHGTPSGLDNTICTYGNLVKFRKNHSTTQLKINTDLNLLLINSKVPRETFKMVSHVAELKTDFPYMVEHILDAMEDLTCAVLDIVQKIDNCTAGGDTDNAWKHFKKWETLIEMNHGLLSSLGVSHQKLEEINIVLKNSGLIGKLTGAGGGGYAISILPPGFDPTDVIRKLAEKGFEAIATKLGGPGVRPSVLCNDS